MSERALTRDRLLKLGVLGAAAAGFAPIRDALAGEASTVAVTPGHFAGRSRFLRHVGSTFRIGSRTRSIHVKLVDARGSEHRYSLLFRGSRHDALPEGTYTVEQRAAGRMELYVSPVGRGVKGQDYEVVVNRVLGARSDV